jgi:acetylornithine deacetylase/succinyl-diaminopimelate desuccinylase-like protein
MNHRHAFAYARSRHGRFVAELSDFICFPSVSAQPQHAKDIRACAGWLAAQLRKIGLEHVQVVPTAGHPVVYADWLHARGRPTLLVYGHYDVQPADPVEAWHSPPFAPTRRGDNLHGRGASDDKGQMFTHVKAMEAYLHTTEQLPVNVKCLFEGEEEIGSPHLPTFLDRHADALAADLAVLSDTQMLGPDRPVISESLRGGLSLELDVRGPQNDLHSGNFGGAIHNPLQALCEMIATMHDARGRVAIPGFYDRVREWGAQERAYMRDAGPSDAKVLADAGASHGWGEAGYSLYERITIRPALTINGITGGYQGEGVKAVIPARASAKINIRLAPDQDPQEIDRLFRAHVRRRAPRTVRVAVRTDLSAKPAVLDRRHPAMRAAAQAYRRGFGVAPTFLRCGGTIPVVSLLKERLGIPTVLMGFALPDDHLHGPDEKIHLPTFFKGVATSIALLEEIASGAPSQLAQHKSPPVFGQVRARQHAAMSP